MEQINPTLYIISWIKHDMEVGLGLAFSLRRLVERYPEVPQVQMLLGGVAPKGQIKHVKRLVDRGLAGQPILKNLAEIEEEILKVSLNELEVQLARLPIRCLLPVMLLIFPSFLMLLVGPWILEIIG